MLSLRNIDLQRGGKTLFQNASLTVYPGHKIGVVGANGVGKSTLFALLQDDIHPDRGEVDLPPRWVSAHLAQETLEPELERGALEYVLDGDAELRQIERALQAAERDRDDGSARFAERLAALHARFEAIDGYSARAQAARVLSGLGFSDAQLMQPVVEFSGGWRMRLNLARTLVCRSDLLLLDEPTNHLDLDAVIWLEQWLRSYPGTLLLISHDRDVLDNVVDHIVHIEQHQFFLHRGNYGAFEERRAAQLALQQAAYAKQQREIAHLQHFISRFRAKASKARQAQSRLKALARMERISAAHVDSPFRFQFRPPERLPNPLLALEQAAVGYSGAPLLRQINLTIQPGTRLGLLGPNGAGKSTFIKLLADFLPALSGQRTPGWGLTIGYFAQHQLEQLRPDWSPLQHLQALDSEASEQALRDFLGGFGFVGEQALVSVAPFSGGEKARLALALLVWQRPNLLLLDEPTNHLDLEMRHALNLALQDYQGALLIVSHDRYLLRTTVDDFLLVADGRVQRFQGDLDDYKSWLIQRQRTNGTDGKSASAADRRTQKRLEAQRRNQLAAKRRPLAQRLEALEQRLDKLHSAKRELESALADPALYETSKKSELKERLLRQGEVNRELAQLEEQWLELQEALEAITLEE